MLWMDSIEPIEVGIPLKYRIMIIIITVIIIIIIIIITIIIIIIIIIGGAGVNLQLLKSRCL